MREKGYRRACTGERRSSRKPDDNERRRNTKTTTATTTTTTKRTSTTEWQRREARNEGVDEDEDEDANEDDADGSWLCRGGGSLAVQCRAERAPSRGCQRKKAGRTPEKGRGGQENPPPPPPPRPRVGPSAAERPRHETNGHQCERERENRWNEKEVTNVARDEQRRLDSRRLAIVVA